PARLPAPQNAAAKSVVSAAWTVAPSAFHTLHQLRCGTGRQVTLTRETTSSPGCPLALRGGRDEVGMVAAIKSECWPASDRNGGRNQVGIGGRLASESAGNGRGILIGRH